MGLVKEPLTVDFEVIPKMLSQKEKEKISMYIKDFKQDITKKTTSKKKNAKSKAII